MADCALCRYLGFDCNPDVEEYTLPCDSFYPDKEQEPIEIELEIAQDEATQEFMKDFLPKGDDDGTA